jgi:ABC-type bacteriocin/lantibiotic exporter with double-glycine peptidase domain
MNTIAPSKANAPTPTPTPIPTLAPVVRPDWWLLVSVLLVSVLLVSVLLASVLLASVLLASVLLASVFAGLDVDVAGVYCRHDQKGQRSVLHSLRGHTASLKSRVY